MADMAMRAWKSAHEEAYADFCKRMDAVAKGDVSVLMDMYLMMQKCTPPEALMMYDRLSNLANGKDVQNMVLIYISTLEILPSSEGFLFNYTYL